MAGQNVQPQYIMAPIGSHTQNTSVSGVVSVTAPVNANAVLVNCQSKAVFFTLDGTAPTATKGLLLEADKGAILIPVYAGQILKFIEASASTKLDYQFVKIGS